MKFIVLTIPAQGHINPTLGIVNELIKDGHKVIVYSTTTYADQIKKIGAEFRPPPIEPDKIDFRVMKNVVNGLELIIDVTKKLYTPTLIQCEKEDADCIIHDSLSLWGKLIAKKTFTPAISLFATLALNRSVILANSRYFINDYREIFTHPIRTTIGIANYYQLYSQTGFTHVPPPWDVDLFGNVEGLNLVCTSDYLQPQRQSFDNRYKFVGPIINIRNENEFPENVFNKKNPIIYIAMGTVYNDNVSFYKTMIDIFNNSPYQVFMSLGSYIKKSQLGHIPSNIIVQPYLPQLQLLQKASVFISHGGANSINESMYFGVPMILFPFIHEQKMNAGRVEKLGAGIYYGDKNIIQENFLSTIKHILSEYRYKNNAQKIGKTLHDSGGSKAAVNFIYDYIQHKR